MPGIFTEKLDALNTIHDDLVTDLVTGLSPDFMELQGKIAEAMGISDRLDRVVEFIVETMWTSAEFEANTLRGTVETVFGVWTAGGFSENPDVAAQEEMEIPESRTVEFFKLDKKD